MSSSILVCSPQGGHLEVLKYLVEEGGASLRILSYDGMSCLHAAAQTGKLDTVKWLVGGASHTRTQTNPQGKNPFATCVRVHSFLQKSRLYKFFAC